VAASLVRLPRRRAVRPVRLPLAGSRLPADAWVMPAPSSFTGEDTVEFHLPGSAPLAAALVESLRRAGARPAEPGEFTRRAFLNGRLDLARAEAVSRIIRAGSEAEYRASRSLLAGEFSRELRRIEEDLLSLAADVEASLDFADQDVQIVSDGEVARRTASLAAALSKLAATCAATRSFEGKPRCVLAGPPNAGKSTLFTALTGVKALADPEPGTTRDLREAPCGRVLIVDAPGLHEARGLDALAVDRARPLMEQADLWLLVAGPGQTHSEPPGETPAWRIRSKADLGAGAPGGIEVSAVTGRGIAGLKRRLQAWAAPGPAARFQLSERQFARLADARESLDRAKSAGGTEVVALELRAGLKALGSITGRDVDEGLLDRVFQRFCLGK
jgi:tRNA modification GTPase